MRARGNRDDTRVRSRARMLALLPRAALTARAETRKAPPLRGLLGWSKLVGAQTPWSWPRRLMLREEFDCFWGYPRRMLKRP